MLLSLEHFKSWGLVVFGNGGSLLHGHVLSDGLARQILNLILGLGNLVIQGSHLRLLGLDLVCHHQSLMLVLIMFGSMGWFWLTNLLEHLANSLEIMANVS